MKNAKPHYKSFPVRASLKTENILKFVENFKFFQKNPAYSKS